MPYAAALSTAPLTADAVEEVVQQLGGRLAGPADLAVVFFSPHHADAAGELSTALRQRLAPRHLVGCVAESIVGNDREVEQSPGLSVWLAAWGNSSSCEPFHLDFENTADGPTLLGWPDGLAEADPQKAVVLALADPYSCPSDVLLGQLNGGTPGLRLMGGMASGVSAPGEARLLLDDRVITQGAVGVLIRGPVRVRGIVSQGCRPIGRHMVVTKLLRDHVIGELSGRSPLERLQELWPELPAADQRLVRHCLHVGRVINEYQGEFQRGDFLVRNVQGIDPDSGALAITDRLRVGQTVQFHVRDADTADEDLYALLRLDRIANGQPAGALLFTCNGRGTRLFAQPNHDARAVRTELGAPPLAGFFAAGEFGPVGGQNFIHGFTASVVLFDA